MSDRWITAVMVLLGALMGFAVAASLVEHETENQFDRVCHAQADTQAQEKFCNRLVLDASN
ncbi:hypothetical protein [Streptomyces sp. NPDC058280]|uniref:hypothetical protein n=1 Tax=Streptomyces sp. NPDC058280 TaxID=3346419 RepID=UPI0036E854ED